MANIGDFEGFAFGVYLRSGRQNTKKCEIVLNMHFNQDIIPMHENIGSIKLKFTKNER